MRILDVIQKVFGFLAVSALSLVLAAPDAYAGATILINNIDDPNQGLNDPTPVKPVGRNNGRTLGEQRLNVFQEAAAIWGDTLDSDVVIVVQTTFQDRGFTPCTANSAVLGAAGTIQIFANFPDTEWPNTWYHVALANALAGQDLAPGPFDPGFLVPPFADDMIAFFNPNLGQPDCLAGTSWYYGLDNKAPAGTIDFLNVVLHELGHGVGFANFIDDESGSGPAGLPDIYTVFSRDNTMRKQWNQMSDLERAASEVNSGNVVWNGPTVVGDAPGILDFLEQLVFTSPPSLAGQAIEFGTAAFGPPPGPDNFSGNVVLANDGTGTVTDGCEPLTNAPAISGNIALIDRGTCTFVTKVNNAQSAGATGVIIANINGGGSFGLGGSDPGITIPAIGISNADGDLIKANLPGVAVAIVVDTTRLAGTDEDGNVRLFAPSPVQPGSSISHWDTVAKPNLLMEPFINADLEGSKTLDLTPSQMTDIGWSGGPHCPLSADLGSATVFVGSCNTGVTNRFGPYTVFPGGQKGLVAGGCTLSDVLATCTGNANFTGCISDVTKALQKAGLISKAERMAIQACAVSGST